MGFDTVPHPAQVLVAFKEGRVIYAVRAADCDAARPLLGQNDSNDFPERLDRHDGLVGLISPFKAQQHSGVFWDSHCMLRVCTR